MKMSTFLVPWPYDVYIENWYILVAINSSYTDDGPSIAGCHNTHFLQLINKNKTIHTDKTLNILHINQTTQT